MSINLKKENGFTLKKQEADNILQKLRHSDYTDDLILIPKILIQIEPLQYSLEKTVGNIGLYMSIWVLN